MIAERMWISIHVPVSTREVGIPQDKNLRTQGWPLNLRPASAWNNNRAMLPPIFASSFPFVPFPT